VEYISTAIATIHGVPAKGDGITGKSLAIRGADEGRGRAGTGIAVLRVYFMVNIVLRPILEAVPGRLTTLGIIKIFNKIRRYVVISESRVGKLSSISIPIFIQPVLIISIYIKAACSA
jgi:hypothetical protein